MTCAEACSYPDLKTVTVATKFERQDWADFQYGRLKEDSFRSSERMWGGYYVAARTRNGKGPHHQAANFQAQRVAWSARHTPQQLKPAATKGVFVGDGLLMWRAVAYCGIPLKNSTVSASGFPNTVVYASPNLGEA